MTTRPLGRRALLRAGLGLAWTSGLLAACANQGADPSTTPVAATAPPVNQVAPTRAGPTIRFFQLTLNNDEAQWWQGGIDRFRLRHPAITVTHEPANWNSFWDRLALYASANQMPDTLLLTTTHTPQYARLEAIQSLGPYTRLDRALHLEDQWPATRRAVTVAGKGPYLLLYELAPLCIYINTALFKQAGLVDPTARLPEYWTFDEFRQAAVTLSGKGEGGQQWGLSSPLTLWTAADALLRSHGGGFASADNTRTLLDTPESIKTMEQIVELVVKNQVSPPIAAGQIGRLWENGRIAMDIAGPERAIRFRDRLRFEWDTAPLPVATRTRLRSNAAQGSGLAMGAGIKEVEAAWLFISEMLSADNLAEMVGKPARGVPGRPSARDALLYSDRAPPHPNLFVEGAEAAACLAVSDFDQFQQLVNPATDAMYSGARPVADVLRELAPKIDSLLRF